jgi:hypothetical protein
LEVAHAGPRGLLLRTLLRCRWRCLVLVLHWRGLLVERVADGVWLQQVQTVVEHIAFEIDVTLEVVIVEVVPNVSQVAKIVVSVIATFSVISTIRISGLCRR